MLYIRWKGDRIEEVEIEMILSLLVETILLKTLNKKEDK